MVNVEIVLLFKARRAQLLFPGCRSAPLCFRFKAGMGHRGAAGSPWSRGFAVGARPVKQALLGWKRLSKWAGRPCRSGPQGTSPEGLFTAPRRPRDEKSPGCDLMSLLRVPGLPKLHGEIMLQLCGFAEHQAAVLNTGRAAAPAPPSCM